MKKSNTLRNVLIAAVAGIAITCICLGAILALNPNTPSSQREIEATRLVVVTATAESTVAGTSPMLASTPATARIELSDGMKRGVYYDLVSAQDIGEDIQAFEIVAQQYDVEVETVRQISIEGIVENWPVPTMSP